MSQRLDLTGYRHPRGRLTALNYSHNHDKQGSVWDCICDCGARKQVAASSVKSGRTLSCGCLRQSQRAAKATKHQAFGGSKSVQEWAQDPRCKINAYLLWERLRSGWEVETAIATPPRKARKPEEQTSGTPKRRGIPLKELLLGRTA
jgi:hypothetical protein